MHFFSQFFTIRYHVSIYIWQKMSKKQPLMFWTIYISSADWANLGRICITVVYKGLLFEKLPSNDQMQKWPILTIKYWILEKSCWYFREIWRKKLHFSKSQLMQKSLVSLNFSVFCYCLKVIWKLRSNGHLIDLLPFTKIEIFLNAQAQTYMCISWRTFCWVVDRNFQ